MKTPKNNKTTDKGCCAEFVEKYQFCPIHTQYKAPTPYNQKDHTHCFDQKNPPCGQKIEHLKCCLCEKLNPEATPSHDCDRNIESNMAPAHCRVCKKDMSTPSLSKGEEWRDNKKLHRIVGEITIAMGIDKGKELVAEIENVVSQTLSNERERMVAIGDSLKKKLGAQPEKDGGQLGNDAYNGGYKQGVHIYQHKIRSLTPNHEN